MSLSSKAVQTALRDHEPSAEQSRAIAHDPIPLAIIAGAGSGKTAVMAARIVWMVEQGLYRPAQILGLTFTNKAAAELEERILRAFAVLEPSPSETPPIATYHSFADKMIREYGVRIGIDPDVGLLSKAQAWQLLMGELENLPPFEAIESRSMSTVLATTLSLADQCSNHLVSPERIIEEDTRIFEEASRFEEDIVSASRQRAEYATIVRAYINAKKKAGRIDFGDQVTAAVEILERFPDVAEELRERYPALLLDEYQDTNVAQRRLLQLLAPTGHNVTAVGDARQNIYQWRGSTLFNLIDFPRKHFLREGEQEHDYAPLSMNYRSGSQILDVANYIVEKIPQQRRPGTPLEADPANGRGRVLTKLCADQYSEAAFIADEILELHGKSTANDRTPVLWRDVAILVRRKSHISVIHQALKERDIPVEVVGLSGLLQLPEVMDVVAWLRVLADAGPPGNRWLARILLGPRMRIHYRDLALLARWSAERTARLEEEKQEADKKRASDLVSIVADSTQLEAEDVAYSLQEALDHLDEIPGLDAEAARRLSSLRDEISVLRRRATGPLLDLVQTVIMNTGIWESLEASIREDAESAKRNLTSFLGVVSNFEPVSGEPSLAAFLEYLDAAEDVEETLEPTTDVVGDSVKLTTIHQAKGLEFEVVFIPSVSARKGEEAEYKDSIFPDTRSSNPMTSYGQLPHGVREDAEHLPNPWKSDREGLPVPKKKSQFKDELSERALEDERRLFYVALTRAKQRLYITAAWWYERQKNARGPSQFFEEVQAVNGVEALASDELAEVNPLTELLQMRGVWPPDAVSARPTQWFGQSYPEFVESLISGEITWKEAISKLAPGIAERAQVLLQEHRDALENLAKVRSLDAPGGDERRLPSSLSVTRAVGLAAGTLSLAEVTRPLPERPSGARRIGTEIHRWIEQQARGLSGLADEDALDEPSAHVDRSFLRELRENYRAMGYEKRRIALLDSGEPMAEVPFVLKAGESLIRGRIDVVYETDDGGLEIVDFKSGQEVETPARDQLLVYAAAVIKMGLKPAGPILLTYAYLAKKKASSRSIEPEQALSSLRELANYLADLP